MKSYTESEHNAAMDRLAADLSAKGAHTPGPWEVLRLGKALYVQPVGGGFVCDMCLDDAEKKAQPTVYADARLIAAAPDLAEACRALVEIEGDATVCAYCHCHRTKHGKHCPVALARAALAKAGL